MTLSEGFHPEDAKAARAGLTEHLKVDEPTFAVRFSADPNLVPFIRVIGHACREGDAYRTEIMKAGNDCS